MAAYYESTLQKNGLSEKLGAEKLAVTWPWRLLVFSFLILLATVVLYAGLAFGYTQFLQTRLTQLDQSIEELAQSIPQEQQQSLIAFYSQLANLQQLLNKHIFPSQLFQFLEKNTNQGVYYDTTELRLADRRVILAGGASSYQVFAQQLEAFNRLPEVEKVIINESYAAEGRISFRIALIVRDALLRK